MSTRPIAIAIVVVALVAIAAFFLGRPSIVRVAGIAQLVLTVLYFLIRWNKSKSD